MDEPEWMQLHPTKRTPTVTLRQSADEPTIDHLDRRRTVFTLRGKAMQAFAEKLTNAASIAGVQWPDVLAR